LKIILATRNSGKITEIKRILTLPQIDFLTYEDFTDWPEVEEEGSNYEENAYIKAAALMEKFGLPAVADDSGLEVDALRGEPGIHSSRYSGQGDEANIALLLNKLKGVPWEERTARFRCWAVFVHPDDVVLAADGLCEGHIGFEPKGEGGFGYDPVFIPLGYEVTMAQLPLQEKNKLSHRGKAFRNLRRKLSQFLND
jgi:XTP/dITP diphosphohydrolase